VIELLLAGVSTLVFTVQKEVADRLNAAPDSSDFGPLTVAVQHLSSVRVIRTLGPGVFWPPPKIDSALVRLDARPGIDLVRARRLSRFVQSIFTFRRKTLRKAITQAGHDAAMFENVCDLTLRPETLAVSTWEAMFARLDMKASDPK
jgi:16S rRNA (adenine1518-N6/adenine1519-N6)-dimethyltransferase